MFHNSPFFLLIVSFIIDKSLDRCLSLWNNKQYINTDNKLPTASYIIPDIFTKFNMKAGLTEMIE